MNKSKCITCKYYDSFFNACTLYVEEIYLGEGDFDFYPAKIEGISKSECEYEEK